MDGVQLCARFSLATNRLDYCGPTGAHQNLYRAATEARGIDQARADLARFEALMPYLETIGLKHGLDPFEFRVVEAYWVGNELLDAFGPEDFRQLLERLVRRGLPKGLARRLADHLPEHPIPHHAFHVSFVGVGNVTGHVETTLANMESCRPGFGTVVRIDGEQFTYSGPPLQFEDGRLGLGADRPHDARLDSMLTPRLQPGDAIAIHWGLPAMVLDPTQLTNLRRYTAASLEAATEALRAGGPGGSLA